MLTTLALDIGTSSVSGALVGDPDHGLLATASVPNDSTVNGAAAACHEQDAERIWALCGDVARALLGRDAGADGSVDRVVLTGQMHGLLLVDACTGRPATNLITWRDRREERVVDEAGYERCGCALHPGYGGLTLSWLQRTLPGGCGGTVAQSICDFVVARLSGVVGTDITHAASWGLLDLGTGTWDVLRIRELGIDRAALPLIRRSCLPLGFCCGEWSADMGIPEGTSVCSPVGDNQASFAGAGKLAAGTAVVSIGTGGQVSVPSSVRTGTYPLEVRPMPDGSFLHVGATLCAGWAYAYLKEFFQQVLDQLGGGRLPDERVYDAMNGFLSQAPGGLRWDTQFQGTRTEPLGRGAISGIDTENLTPAALTHACVQGIVDELAGFGGGSTGLSGIQRTVVTGTAAERIPGLVERIGRALCCPSSMHHGEWDAVSGAVLLSGIQGVGTGAAI